jgi:AcrR family transcriptional regulator
METLTQTRSSRPGSDERRTTIIRTAHAAFLADGYAATSMSTIAARLGGSKATLYNYFASKEELFAAVVAQKCEQIRAIVEDVKVENDDFSSALFKFGMHLIKLLLSDESVATFRMVVAESGRFPELGRAFYEAGRRQGMDTIAGFLAQAIDKGYLRTEDTYLMAQTFFDLCVSDLHKRRLCNVKPEPSKEEMRKTIERGVTIFLKIFGKDAPAFSAI